VAHNVAELVADAITLAELQLELFRCDWQTSLARIIWPAALLAAALLVLASCVPLALVCVTLVLVEVARFTPAQAAGITLGGSLVLGGAAALAGAVLLRKGLGVWQRSRTELAENVRWFKRVFHRFGQLASRPRPEPTPY
jgi:hypothetical protein